MTYRFQAEIKAEHLRAMSHLAAQNDVRYYLNGVMLVAKPEVLLVATDGGVLGVLNTGQLAGSRFEVRVPNEVLKAMGKVKGAVQIGSDDGEAWTLRAGPVSLQWKAQQEKYPDWTRAMPRQANGAMSRFSALDIVKFNKVADALGLTADAMRMQIAHNEPAAGLISFPAFAGFIGLMQPLNRGPKFPEPVTSPPAWALEHPAIPADWRERAEGTCDLA